MVVGSWSTVVGFCPELLVMFSSSYGFFLLVCLGWVPFGCVLVSYQLLGVFFFFFLFFI